MPTKLTRPPSTVAQWRASHPATNVVSSAKVGDVGEDNEYQRESGKPVVLLNPPATFEQRVRHAGKELSRSLDEEAWRRKQVEIRAEMRREAKGG